MEIEVGALVGSVEFFHKAKRYEVLVYEVALLDNELTPTVHGEVGWFDLDAVSALDLADSDRRILALLSKSAG